MICTCFNLKYISDIPVIDTVNQITQLPQYIISECIFEPQISRFACVWCSYREITDRNDAETCKIIQIPGELLPLDIQKPSQRGNSSPFTPSQAGHLPPPHPPPCLHSTQHTASPCVGCPCARSFSAPPARSKDPPHLSPVPYLLCAVLTD